MKTLTTVIVLATTNCTRTPPVEDHPLPFRVAVEATSDPGKPVAGVEVRTADGPVGRTNELGKITIKVEGFEGDSIPLVAKCPPLYEPPTTNFTVALHKFAESAVVPTYTVQCLPALRTYVVAIRTENGANLPVVRLGRRVGQTDESGIAHVLLEAQPGEIIELSLNTEGPGTERLRPQDPSLSFVAKPRDDYVLLDQKFVEEKPKPVFHPVHRPTKLNSLTDY